MGQGCRQGEEKDEGLVETACQHDIRCAIAHSWEMLRRRPLTDFPSSKLLCVTVSEELPPPIRPVPS